MSVVALDRAQWINYSFVKCSTFQFCIYYVALLNKFWIDGIFLIFEQERLPYLFEYKLWSAVMRRWQKRNLTSGLKIELFVILL